MDKPAVRLALKTLPKDLNETYDRILQNIPRTCAPNAIKLLQLLVFSKRPLLLEEVVDAVATDPDLEASFAFENRMYPPTAVIGYCPSLLRITTSHDGRRSEPIGPGSEARFTVRLAHFSIQEYLLLGRKENPYYESFTQQSANAKITQLCLAFLWIAAEASGTNHSVSDFHLAHYAARYWLYHARIAGDSDETTFTWTTKFFSWTKNFPTNNNFMDHCWQSNAPVEVNDLSPGLALYNVSLGGLCRSAKHLLEVGADVNGFGPDYPSPLQGACRSGSIETIQLLIDHGAHVNPRTEIQNPLLFAARTGNVEVLRVLLKNGADVNSTDGLKTALFQASESGHPEVVQILLEHGADVNLISRTGTALHKAGRQLLMRSRSYSPQDSANWIRIVQILLDHGADVNFHPKEFKPVLTSVSESGVMEALQLLLTHGADINVAGGSWDNALYAATYRGHKEAVRVLLVRGADVNAHSGQYGYALLAACHPSSGSIDKEIVQLLLDNGANPNVLGESYGNALCAASKHGDAEVVEMLLQGGADVDAVSMGYYNVLSFAARCGQIEVLRVLLANGARSNIYGRPYHHAIIGAFSSGHKDITQLLFEEDAIRQLEMTKAKSYTRLRVRHIYTVERSLANMGSARHRMRFLTLG
jgi:ankyrin repeat protein